MNLLGILSLLLITSNSVLCRRIHRQDLKDEAEEDSSDRLKMKEETIQNKNHSMELESLDVTTPRAEILQENAAVTTQDQSTGSTPLDQQGKLVKPMSKKRIQKMLKKAVMEIITGDLTSADMYLLKSLNYDAEQVRMIRREEIEKKKNIQEKINEKKKPKNHTKVDNEKPKIEHDWEKSSAESHEGGNNGFDYDAFNKQATFDYEYAASNFDATNGSWDESHSEYDERMKSSTETFPGIGGSLEKNVVFKINYNDSEFDSSSEENPQLFGAENHQSAANGSENNSSAAGTFASSSPVPRDDQIDTLSELYNVHKNYFSTTENTVEENNEVDSQTIPSRKQNEDFRFSFSTTQRPEAHFHYENVQELSEGEENRTGFPVSVASLSSTPQTPNVESNSTSGDNRTTLQPPKYKGLRWVQDHVYQVIPEYIDFMPTEAEKETTDSSYDDASYLNIDDVTFKNKNNQDASPAEGVSYVPSDSIQLSEANGDVSAENSFNLTAHQLQQQAQRQKTEDEIKSRVLLVTGRLNSTSNSNPLQPRREKLVMFSATCEMPRNTDAELWQDPYSMNMQFHLNLTSNQHLVAARLRLFKIPQDNATTTASTNLDGTENDDKKIRISVYYYTRSLRKHRSTRKRLIDSKVASLITTVNHLALDVKDAVRYWRRSSGSRNTNHGLLVLVEDQEGRPLQPSHYIQTSNCHNDTDSILQDEKAYQRVPALFVQACTRYVRFVGNRVHTSEFCGSDLEPVSSENETNYY